MTLSLALPCWVHGPDPINQLPLSSHDSVRNTGTLSWASFRDGRTEKSQTSLLLLRAFLTSPTDLKLSSDMALVHGKRERGRMGGERIGTPPVTSNLEVTDRSLSSKGLTVVGHLSPQALPQIFKLHTHPPAMSRTPLFFTTGTRSS